MSRPGGGIPFEPVARLRAAVLYLAEFAEEQGADFGLMAEDGFDYALLKELRGEPDDD